MTPTRDSTRQRAAFVLRFRAGLERLEVGFCHSLERQAAYLASCLLGSHPPPDQRRAGYHRDALANACPPVFVNSAFDFLNILDSFVTNIFHQFVILFTS